MLRSHLNSEGQRELQAFIEELADEKTAEAAEKLLESREAGNDSTVDAANELADEALFYRKMLGKLLEFSSPDFAFEGCKVVSTHDTTPPAE